MKESVCLELGCSHCYEHKPDLVSKSLSEEMISKPPKSYSFENSLKEFRHVKTISTGRFGSTYLSAHAKTDKFVHVSVYHKLLLQDVFQQHIPFREKKILENLDHPCINKILCALADQNSLYFVFDCQSLISLSSYIYESVKYGGIGESYSVFLVACVLSTLKYCHSKHILHRGLHPDSILIDWKGNVRVTDWAFAKLVEERSYTLCGHVDYLCPEALLGEAGYAKGIDYWALGVLAFEVLVGRSPFVPVESQWQQLERERGGIGATKVRGVSSDHSLGLIDESTHSVLNSSSSSPPQSIHGKNLLPKRQACDLQTIENILYSDPPYPIDLSHPAKTLIKGLCTKKVNLRLGCRRRDGFEEISCQTWFRGTDWKAIEKGQAAPPQPPLPLELPNHTKLPSLSMVIANTPPYRGYNCPDWREFEFCVSLPAVPNIR